VSQDDGKGAPAVSLSEFSVTNFSRVQQESLDVRREDARRLISVLIIGAFVFIIVASFLAFGWFLWRTPNITVDDIVKFCQALIGPVAGIVGAVAGFYFGASQAQRNSASPSP
jgi:hypothetical protein